MLVHFLIKTLIFVRRTFWHKKHSWFYMRSVLQRKWFSLWGQENPVLSVPKSDLRYVASTDFFHQIEIVVLLKPSLQNVCLEWHWIDIEGTLGGLILYGTSASVCLIGTFTRAVYHLNCNIWIRLMSKVSGKMYFRTAINYKDWSLSQQMFLIDLANFINMWLNSSGGLWHVAIAVATFMFNY